MNFPLLIGVEASVSRPSSDSSSILSSMHPPNRVLRRCVVPRDGDIGGCRAAVHRDSKGQITIRVEESPIYCESKGATGTRRMMFGSESYLQRCNYVDYLLLKLVLHFWKCLLNWINGIMLQKFCLGSCSLFTYY